MAPHVLRVGCPMWAHPPWVGRFLSPGNRGRGLAEYARWCNAVEGNTTFYAVPSARAVARCAEQPSFGPDMLATRRSFVGRLPRSRRWVVEFRHPGYFDGGAAHRSADQLLREAGIGRVVLDTRPLYASSPTSDAAVDERRTKPRLPVLTDVMGASPLVRVIGSDDLDGTAEGLRAWVPQLSVWIAEGREPYLFVHQPENLESPALPRMIHAGGAAAVEGLAVLPTRLPVAPASEVVGQDALF